MILCPGSDYGSRVDWCAPTPHWTLGSLSKDCFEWFMSTESKGISVFMCLEANKFVFLSFFSLIKTIYPTSGWRPSLSTYTRGSKGGAVVRALVSHQCHLGSNPYVGWVCCWFSPVVPRGFSQGASVLNFNLIWNVQTHLNREKWEKKQLRFAAAN